MLGHVISCYKKYFHYRVPLCNDPGLFSNQASKQNATCLLGLLKHAFCHDLSTNDCVEAMCLESIAEMIFRQPVAYCNKSTQHKRAMGSISLVIELWE